MPFKNILMFIYWVEGLSTVHARNSMIMSAQQNLITQLSIEDISNMTNRALLIIAFMVILDR